MKANLFIDHLIERNYTFFTGVPCSYLSAFISAIPDNPLVRHVPAVREDIALGMASGAALRGSGSLVYMQNSGLGYSLEAFASLNLIYGIPLLVLMSHRGPEDPGMEEHRLMGQHTLQLLNAFAMPYLDFQSENWKNCLHTLLAEIDKQGIPGFLLIGKGDLQ